MILEYRGYAVDTAENGEHALEKMRASTTPCLVLLDLMMPVMDGWKLWNEMIKDDDLASVPVVVLSGIAEFPAARVINAAAHLRKPVELSRLYQVIEKFC
jgi:CheY-like chemotaxis protein